MSSLYSWFISRDNRAYIGISHRGTLFNYPLIIVVNSDWFTIFLSIMPSNNLSVKKDPLMHNNANIMYNAVPNIFQIHRTLYKRPMICR